MGVGRENKDIFFGPYVQQNEMQVLESQSSGQSTDEEDVNNPPRSTIPRRRFRGARARSASLEACLTGMYRRCGARQARRTEHIKHLLSLKDGEEGVETQTPTYGPHTSPFTQLFQQRQKMQAWNDFVNSSEEDQERILEMRTKALSLTSIREESDISDDGADSDKKKRNVNDRRRRSSLQDQASYGRDSSDDNGNLDDSWEKVDDPCNEDDKRSVHPSFSAAECFQRVDKNLRAMLTRRHLPLGLVWQLEREVVEFFQVCPGSVFISEVTTSFERMLLHAVCQYLGLSCRSYEDGGQRRTQVENRNPAFVLPSQSLAQFLETSRS